MKNYNIELEEQEFIIKDEKEKNLVTLFASKGEKGDPGAPGQDGAPGLPGNDGYSPSANVSKSGNTATITITDKNGTTTASVNDGQNGQDGYTPVKGVDYFTEEDITSLNIPTKTSDLTNDTGFISNETDPVFSSSASASITSTDISNWNNKSDFSGNYNDLSNKPTIPTKTSDLTNDSNFMSGMTILAYGKSTWNDFITAYTNKQVVYCRASSNANPATGSQTRMAFMAYVNNETTPTNVEFQYVRSISSHSASQQGDQVFVYKLTNANGGTWSVETREMSTKIVPSTGLSGSYSNGVYTLSSTITKTSDLTNDSGFINKNVYDLTNYYEKNYIDTIVNGIYHAISSDIAPFYDNTSTYSIGDYVNWLGYLYVCTTDISVPEDFDFNHWLAVDVTSLLNDKENTSNKVTSISSSSTNAQYPSAKCVYDLVGDIESLLSEV